MGEKERDRKSGIEMEKEKSERSVGEKKRRERGLEWRKTEK